MPPDSTAAPPGQSSTTRRRPTSERVVPAIPLALTRPRPTKIKPETVPKPEVNVKVENEHVTSVNGKANGLGSLPASAVVTNGGITPPVEAVADAGSNTPTKVVENGDAQTPGSEGSAEMSISASTTPEVPTTASERPPTPPPAAETIITTMSPTSARNFDMSRIRTELPPAFVPSAEQYTPRSAASMQSNRPQFLPHAHPTHPSMGSIVFGGQDSTTSSPAPPLSGGSGFAPPPFSGSQQPYFAQNGHAHHVSEPYGPRVHQPNHQQPMPWGVRRPYGQQSSNASFHHSHAHAPFRYPPREVFTPTEPHMPNGSASRSGSQASSGAHDGNHIGQILQSPTHMNGSREPQTIKPRNADPRPSSYHQTMHQPLPPFPAPGLNPDFENSDALRSHIVSESSNPEFADCPLEIVDSIGGATLQFNGHKIVLSRSPTLLDLIRKAKASSSSAETIEVTLQGRYNHADTLVDALKYLYGGPLLQLSYQRPGSSAGEQLPSNTDRMESALRHISIGSWLKVPALAARGVEVATSLLHWDTILPALAFALEGGLSHVWAVDDGSEDRASTSSSEDSLSRSEPMGIPTYDPHATHLLQRMLDFTVHMFPPNFYLDASAPHLTFCPRLPSIPQGHASRGSKSDPRLTHIRFGEVPVEELQRPSLLTSSISSILLSLPFVLLKWVLEHYDLVARLGPETVGSIMRQVVAEREIRRVKAEKARNAGQLAGETDSTLLQNLLWEESVEPSTQHRAGFRLFRRKKDIDTPPSSGACSELNK